MVSLRSTHPIHIRAHGISGVHDCAASRIAQDCGYRSCAGTGPAIADPNGTAVMFGDAVIRAGHVGPRKATKQRREGRATLAVSAVTCELDLDEP
jgi:hypothetical protein